MSYSKFFVSIDEYLMDRDKLVPLNPEQISNVNTLIPKINELLERHHKDTNCSDKHTISSGYRPEVINKNVKGAAKKSAHMSCEAVDLTDDKNQELGNWCKNNIKILEELGLYMEDLSYTKGEYTNWCHLQTRKTKRRIFIPY